MIQRTTDATAPQPQTMTRDEIATRARAWALTDWWHILTGPLDPARYLAEITYYRLTERRAAVTYEDVSAAVTDWLTTDKLLVASRREAEDYRQDWRTRRDAAANEAHAAAGRKDWPAAHAALTTLCDLAPDHVIAHGRTAEDVRDILADRIATP